MRVGSQCDPLIAGDNEPTLGSESPGCGRDTHPSACCRTVPLEAPDMHPPTCRAFGAEPTDPTHAGRKCKRSVTKGAHTVL